MSAVLQQLMRKLRLNIGTGLLKLVDDARKIQQVQITLLDGEVRSNVNRMQDYGFTSVPLEGAEALLAAVGGNRDHLIAIRVDDGRHRKKGLTAGEVALYSDEGDYILLKRGRIIEVLAGTKLKVTAPEVEIIASTKVTITSPTVEMSGTLAVQGNITSQATITGNSVRTASGKILESHTHGSVQNGPGITGAPT